MVSGNDDIVESLRLLFGTQVGERILEPRYGSELSTMLFTSATTSERTVLETTLRRAILHFEPRIEVEGLSVDTSDATQGILRIRVQYLVSATNSRRNIVFPYFLEEGTLVPTG